MIAARSAHSVAAIGLLTVIPWPTQTSIHVGHVGIFADWLEEKLKKRDWQPADLARRTGLHTGSVSRILNGTRKPGADMCRGIAEALNVPPEIVFRQAGLLPSKTEIDPQAEEFIPLFRQLDTTDRKRLLQIARVWVEDESA